MSLSVEFSSEFPVRLPKLGFVITTHDGTPIINANNRFQVSPEYASPVCHGQIHCELGALPLVAGHYEINLYLGNLSEDIDIIEKALSFEVIERDIWGQGKVPPSNVSYLWWPTTFKFSSA